MMEAMIDRATVPGEGPATILAAEATTFAPPSLVEAETNDQSRRWFCSERTSKGWTAQFLHGMEAHFSEDLAISKIGLKPYHMNRLQFPQQQLIAEAPEIDAKT